MDFKISRNRRKMHALIAELNLPRIFYSAAFGEERRELFDGPLGDVLSRRPRSWSELLAFLTEPDLLTATLYQNEGDEILIPSLYGDIFRRCAIGEQYSRHHRENLAAHAATVYIGLWEAALPTCETLALALLHDIGKKYCAALNRHGEVCFYGHAQLSALFAAHWLPDDFPHRWADVAAIYYHMHPKVEDWAHHPKRATTVRLELQQFFSNAKPADEALGLIEQLSRCDIGCIHPDEILKWDENLDWATQRIEQLDDHFRRLCRLDQLPMGAHTGQPNIARVMPRRYLCSASQT